jgi:hypothetical protein
MVKTQFSLNHTYRSQELVHTFTLRPIKGQKQGKHESLESQMLSRDSSNPARVNACGENENLETHFLRNHFFFSNPGFHSESHRPHNISEYEFLSVSSE